MYNDRLTIKCGQVDLLIYCAIWLKGEFNYCYGDDISAMVIKKTLWW